jgi:hypothetical protein
MRSFRRTWFALVGAVLLVALSVSVAFGAKPSGTAEGTRGQTIAAFVHDLVLGDQADDEDSDEEEDSDEDTDEDSDADEDEDSDADEDEDSDESDEEDSDGDRASGAEHGACVSAEARDKADENPEEDGNHGAVVSEAARDTCWEPAGDDEATDEDSDEEDSEDAADEGGDNEDSVKSAKEERRAEREAAKAEAKAAKAEAREARGAAKAEARAARQAAKAERMAAKAERRQGRHTRRQGARKGPLGPLPTHRRARAARSGLFPCLRIEGSVAALGRASWLVRDAGRLVGIRARPLPHSLILEIPFLLGHLRLVARGALLRIDVGVHAVLRDRTLSAVTHGPMHRTARASRPIAQYTITRRAPSPLRMASNAPSSCSKPMRSKTSRSSGSRPSR